MVFFSVPASVISAGMADVMRPDTAGSHSIGTSVCEKFLVDRMCHVDVDVVSRGLFGAVEESPVAAAKILGKETTRHVVFEVAPHVVLGPIPVAVIQHPKRTLLPPVLQVAFQEFVDPLIVSEELIPFRLCDGKVPSREIETFQLDNNNVLLKSPYNFYEAGECGMRLGELIPHVSSIADEICLVRSMHTGHNNHPFAINMMQTGKTFAGRPAMGSWICSGLGTERDDLPGYVVLRSPKGYNTSGKMVWSSGWLPAVYQGTEFNSSGDVVHYLSSRPGTRAAGRRRALDLLAKLNRRHQELYPRESELEARIQNYELAARMQVAASSALDLKQESKATRAAYGLDNPVTAAYGARVLMARRLVEAGVRFVQVFPPVSPSSQPWDNHNNLPKDLPNICRQTDQPSAALVKDLTVSYTHLTLPTILLV